MSSTQKKVNNANYHLRACDRKEDGHSVIAKLVQFGRRVDQAVDSNGASDPRRRPTRPQGMRLFRRGNRARRGVRGGGLRLGLRKETKKEKDPINRCTIRDESDFDTPR
jgi:hypothetical protein